MKFYTKDKVDELFLNKKTEVVAPTSDSALSGKAADAYETGIRKADGVVLYSCSVSPEMSNILGVIGKPTDKNFVRYVNGVKRPIVITEDDEYINIVLADKTTAWVDEDWFYDKAQKRIDCETGSGELIGVYAKTALEALGLTDSAKAALFTDTAFSEACAYKLHSLVDADKNSLGAFVCHNRAINAITVGADAVTLEFPTKADGETYGRDFLIRITGGAGGLTINLPTETSKHYGDAFPTVEGDNNYLIAITETGTDEWFVKSIELTEAQ